MLLIEKKIEKKISKFHTRSLWNTHILSWIWSIRYTVSDVACHYYDVSFTIDCSTVYDRRNVRYTVYAVLIDKRLSIDDQKSRTVSTTTIEHTRFDVSRVCGWLGGLVMYVYVGVCLYARLNFLIFAYSLA